MALIEELRVAPQGDERAYERISRKHDRRGGGLFAKSEVILAYRRLADCRGWSEGEDAFVARMRMKPIRTQSGVAPVTLLTRPHPCPGRCLFCPDDELMPKSYVSLEPGAQRAARYGFDPFRQVWNRLRALDNNGHRTDKVELIVLGGTWTSYPQAYRLWFVTRSFQALNAFDGGEDEPPAPPGDEADLAELAAAQRANETARCRAVGLSVETRPDALACAADVEELRRLGATKVQLGYQSLDDEVLERNERGHDVAATRRATLLLRAAGFKIQAHWMPNLLGSDARQDLLDFEHMFADPDFRPDEIKIYPCCLLASSALASLHRAGKWRPYDEGVLLDLLVAMAAATPEYCRISRIARDIPAHDVLAGNRAGNLRERVEAELRRRGSRGRDIRARQIRRPLSDLAAVRLREVEYEAGGGREVFLQGETEQDELVGFLRLFLPEEPSCVAELGESALVREVHVYGVVAGFERDREGTSQHQGLGSRLLERAEELALRRGRSAMAVISAVGTRDYYRRRGFADGVLYQHKRLS
ncbi:MAG: tRNA uridine(34) 5-carboxymethylaminomethyl modification radical SAM/GNAT enzyme Elp3 [Planctomycetes bacterium]|nr:tRNA uridine(34) 5-carboxymethylaminomethyl modification radical SAM/GNAT enzyme Elp3 [Planctomycetota bacterium]